MNRYDEAQREVDARLAALRDQREDNRQAIVRLRYDVNTLRAVAGVALFLAILSLAVAIEATWSVDSQRVATDEAQSDDGLRHAGHAPLDGRPVLIERDR